MNRYKKIITGLITLSMFVFFVIGSSSIHAEDETNPNTEETQNNANWGPSEEETIPLPETEPKEEVKDESQKEIEIIEKKIETPASVTGERYQGSGTVVDFTTTGSKAFYTIKTRDNSVFYIVIDLDKTEDNVYFLTEINGDELTLKEITTKPSIEPVQPQENIKSSGKKSGIGDSLFYVCVVLMGCVILIYGFHKKVKKKNPNAKFIDTVKQVVNGKSSEQKSNSKKIDEEEESLDDDYDFEDDYDDDDDIDYE